MQSPQRERRRRLCKEITGNSCDILQVYRQPPAGTIRTTEKLQVNIANKLVPLLLVVTASPLEDGNWKIEAELSFDPPGARRIVSIVMIYRKHEYLFIESFRNYATKPNVKKSSGFTFAEQYGLRNIGRRIFCMLLCVVVLQWPFLLERKEDTLVVLVAASLIVHIAEGNDEKLAKYYEGLGFERVALQGAEEGIPMAATVERLLSVCEETHL